MRLRKIRVRALSGGDDLCEDNLFDIVDQRLVALQKVNKQRMMIKIQITQIRLEIAKDVFTTEEEARERAKKLVV